MRTSPGARVDGASRDYQHWQDSTRVVLQPVAPPSVLGLFGFAIATFMVSTYVAGWYGTTISPEFLGPFAAVVGGIAQLIACVWAYRARDVVATAVHGLWGSFWVSYGLLFLLAATGALTIPTGKFPELAIWLFPLAAVTLACAFAATAENLAIAITLVGLMGGAALLGIGYLTGSRTWLHVGGYVLFADSIAAFYTGVALMFRAAFGRVVLPTGEPKAAANIPDHGITHPLEFEFERTEGQAGTVDARRLTTARGRERGVGQAPSATTRHCKSCSRKAGPRRPPPICSGRPKLLVCGGSPDPPSICSVWK